MSYIKTDIAKAKAELENYRASYNRMTNNISPLRNIKYSSAMKGRGFDVAIQKLDDVVNHMEESIQKCAELSSGLEQIIGEYEATEAALTEYIPTFLTSASASGPGYKFDDDHPGVKAWLGKAEASIRTEYAEASVTATVGKVSAEAKAEYGLFRTKHKKEFKNGKWEEKDSAELLFLEGSAGVSAVAATVTAQGSVGNEYVNLKGKATGEIGKAEAKAKGKLSIGEDGVNAYVEGSAIVSAVEGKAEAEFNFLGIKVKAKGSAYAGAAGVEGKVGIKDGTFVIEGGLAAGVGLSGGLEIGIDTAFWEGVSSTVEDVAGGVADAFNGFVDFITFWD